MLRNSRKSFFAVIFLAAIYAAVFTQTPTSAQTLRSTFPATYGNEGFVVNPTTNRIYVLGASQSGERIVNVIDATDGSSLALIPLEYPYGVHFGAMAVNPGTNRIYVASRLDLLVIDGDTNSIISRIELPPNPYLLRGPVVDSLSNRIYLYFWVGGIGNDPNGTEGMYVIDGNTNSILTRIETHDQPALGAWWGAMSWYGMAINPSTHRIYMPLESGGSPGFDKLMVVDGTNNSFATIPLDFRPDGEIVVNPTTNRIYVSGTDYRTYEEGQLTVIGVIDGASNTVVGKIPIPGDYSILWSSEEGTYQMGIDTATDRIYKFGREFDYAIATIDGNSNSLISRARVSLPAGLGGDRFYLTVDSSNHFIYTGANDGDLGHQFIAVINPGSTQVSGTGDVTASADNATLSFTNVTNPGTVSVTPISDPATAGDVPGGFAISNTAAYEITKDTNLQFSGPVTTCFRVPNVTDVATFATLRVLHRELNSTTGQYELVDRTTSNDFATHTVCATTTSFSPFYIARAGSKIISLFDRSKAYKAGSSVPVKLQLFDAANSNISSAAIALTPRGLLLVGGNTTSSVIDSGQSNADGNFRYDPTLQGYIFNLSTKGLAPGQYVLSIYAGGDRSFFYAVKFEVK